MASAKGNALEWALALSRAPMERHALRQRVLPDGIDAVLGIAADAAPRDRTVIEAVLSLPLSQRQAALLRYWQGLTIAETAQVLRLSPEAIKKRLRRANARLRAELEGWYYDDESD